jgi:hypothetical protein
MKRALVLALLAAPTLGAAQTVVPALPGQIVFRPDALAGAQECADPARTITTNWNVGVPVTALGRYQVFAANKAPPAATTGVRTCLRTDNEQESTFADVVSIDVSPTTSQPTIEIPVRPMIEAANDPDDTDGACTNESVQTIHVCVEYYARAGDSDPVASAVGSFQFDPRVPAVPTITLVEPGEAALYVAWAEGAGGAVEATRFRAIARGPAEDPGPYVQESVENPVRVGGLRNGLTYSVTGVALSEAGTESAESDPPVTASPVEVDDFWEHYSRDGRETGGCASGPGGLLALFTASALLLFRGRRK